MGNAAQKFSLGNLPKKVESQKRHPLTPSLGSKIGRGLVYSDSDLPTAYGLAKLIQLVPLSQ